MSSVADNIGTTDMNNPKVGPASRGFCTLRHPEVVDPVLYIHRAAPHWTVWSLQHMFRSCGPVQVSLQPIVPVQERFMPEAHYYLMGNKGRIEFANLHQTEKAVALFYNLARRGLVLLVLSPYPMSEWSLPMVPTSPSQARCIFSDGSGDVIPDDIEMFEQLRKWGSIAELAIMPTEFWDGGVSLPTTKWMCRVVFCFSHEAQRFEENCESILGWQVNVCRDYIEIGENGTPNRALPPLPIMEKGYIGSPEYGHLHLPYQLPPSAVELVAPASPVHSGAPSLGLQSASMVRSSSMALPERVHDDLSPPRKYASLPGIPRPQFPSPVRRPVGPPSVDPENKWGTMTEILPDGQLRVSGIKDSLGRIIKHGEGQHIRPLPAVDPATGEQDDRRLSILVDYTNLYIRPLGPDVNSAWLSSHCGQYGQVVQCKVSRLPNGQSRKSAFVSFQTEQETELARRGLDGSRFLGTRIKASLHRVNKTILDKGPNHSGPSALGLY